ncbi:hypothetical protein [Streptomyces sp. NPDC048295]|uniref:hypothetical protein n=1 Tax=Streptomyces sp. NPDC048295 TaxID=3154617 RepID=UPI003445040B
MARFVRWYGSGPLHLLVLIASFALTGYALVRLFDVRPVEVAIWFVGAAIVHDLFLLPLYSLADLSAQAVLRHRAPRMPQSPWINYLRVPAFLSGVLLLVWFPSSSTSRSPTPMPHDCPKMSISADGWPSPPCSSVPPPLPSPSSSAASGEPPAPTRNNPRRVRTPHHDARQGAVSLRRRGPLRTCPAQQP